MGKFLFFVLLFPVLGHAQFKSYDNSNFSGSISVTQIPDMSYHDTTLAINYQIKPIVPYANLINDYVVITSASISPALPSGLSINNAGIISGSTSVLTASTRYVITLGNPCGSSTAVMWLKTAVGPTITKQTTCPDVICNTADLQSFYVEATGTNLRYQWRKDGLPLSDGYLNGSFISGVTSSRMDIMVPNSSFANANYDVIISNDECSIVSESKSFIILNAPEIIAQPQAPNRVCEKNGIQTLSVSATGRTALTYQWRKDGVSIIDTGLYNGSTTNTLRLTNPALTDTGNYDIVVSDDFCPKYSNEVPVKLDFVRFVGATNTTDTVFCEGQGIKTIALTPIGTNFSLEWRQFGPPYNGYEGGIEGSEYSGSSTSTLTITNPTARNGGTYTLTAYNRSCNIVDRATGSLVIKKNPQITRELSGESVQIDINSTPFDGLKLNITAKGENPTFIWRRNGIPIPESELNSGSLYVKYVIRDPVDTRDWSEVFSASLFIKQASYETTEGTYDVVVKTLGCLNDTSQPYVVRFNRVPTTITRHPQVPADYLCSNEDVYLRVKATGANLSYTWRRNGELLNTIPSGQNGVQDNWVLFPGDTMLLIRGSYNNNTEGIYDVLITGAAEPVFSNPTTLRRYPAPQLLTENNNQFYFCRKDSNIITIKAKAVYGDSLRFTWNIPSTNSQRINGEVRTTYNGDYVNFSTPISKNLANGSYQYTVTNHCGQSETRYVQIQFNGEPSDSLEARVVVPTLACNRAANITLTTAGTSTNTGLIYQWQKDGIDLPLNDKYATSTSRHLNINNLTFADSGYYELNLQYPLNQGGCRISSGKTYLKIDSNSTIIAAPVRPPATFERQGVQTLSVVAQGNNLNYTWSRDWINISNNAVFSGQGTPNLAITNSSDDQGLYRVVVTGACLLDIDSTIKSSITLSPVTLRFFTRILIASQPSEFSTVCAGDNFANGNVFSYARIIESSNYDGYLTQTTYQWRKNSVGLTDQDFGGGRKITGTNTQQIQILMPNQSDSGDYDLLVIQHCYDPLYNTSLTIPILTASIKLKVNLPVSTKTYADIIEGSGYYRWEKNGRLYDQSGTYYNTSTCNLDTLVLTVVPASQTDTIATICQGQTFRWSANQIEYSQSGNYTYNNNGLTYRLRLTVRPRPSVVLTGSATICEGTSASLTISQNNGYGINSGVLSDGTSFNGSGNSTIIIPVSPTTTTNYSVSSLTDGVCNAQASNISGNALVSVLASPAASLSAPAWDCGANIDNPVTVHLTLDGPGPWWGTLSNGYSFNSLTNTVDIPVSYASGTTIRVASLYNQQRCFATPSMLTGSLYIPAKSGIVYVNPSDNTPFYAYNYSKSQKLCRSDNWTMRPIMYRVSNGDSLVVTGLPSGVTASFMNTYSYNDLVGRSQTINKALVISGAPSVEGVFRYYVSVPANAGCGIAIDSGVITNLRSSLTLTQGSNNQSNAFSGIPIDTIRYVATNANALEATIEGLAPGLVANWNNNQLTISGMPTSWGTYYNYSIYLTDVCGARWLAASGSINVLGVGLNTPINVTPNNRYACKDLPITDKIWKFPAPTLNDGHTSVTGLPAGLTASWTIDTLTISGTPTETGVFTYVISVSNAPNLVNVIEVLGRDTLSLFSGMSSQTVCSGSYIDPMVFRTNTVNAITSFYVSGLQNGINTVYTQNQASFNGSVIGSGAHPYKLYVNGACNRDSIGGVITIIDNTSEISLTSAESTNTQYVCIQSPIVPITYQSLSAVDYSVTGLPRGLTVNWSNQILTISGSPIEGGDFNYSVTVYYQGNCGSTTKTGRIVVASGNVVSNTLSDTLNVLNGSFSRFYLDFNTQNALNGNLSAAPVAVGLPSGLIAQSRVGNNGIVGVDLNGSPNDLPGYYNFTITSNAHCGAPTISGVVRVDSLYTYELKSYSATTFQQICLNGAITPVVYKASQITSADYIEVRGLPSGVSVRGATRVAGNELDADSSIVFCNISNLVYKSVYRLSLNRYNQSSPVSIIIEGTPTQAGRFDYTISDNRGLTGWGRLTLVRSNTIIVASSELALASGKDLDQSCRAQYTSLSPVNVFDIGDSSQLRNLGSPISPIVFGMGEGVSSITTTGLPAGLNTAMSTHSHISDGLPRKSYEITGTPTVTGTFNYRVTVSGSCGVRIYKGTIVIKQNPTIALSSGITTQELCKDAAMAPVQFGIQNGGNGAVALGLPNGVTGSFANGIFTISGNPQQAGTYNYVIKPIDTSYTVLDRLLRNVKVALGLRKLVKEYTGPAIRLKRSDGATQDFGFVGDELDTASINSWQNEVAQSLRASFCIKLYDQSGNGADFVAPEPAVDSNGYPISNYPLLNIEYEFSSLNNTERFPVLPRLSFNNVGVLLNSRIYSAPYTTALGLDPRANYGNVADTIHRTFFKQANLQSGLSVDASLANNSQTGLFPEAVAQMSQIGNNWNIFNYLFTGLVVFDKELSGLERDEVANFLDAYYSKYKLTSATTNSYKVSGTITVKALPEITVESSSFKNCVNDAVTLTASGAQSYLWNDNSTGNVHVVHPQSTSTYSVSGTDQFGCSKVGNIVVPVSSYITNHDTTICENRSVVLSASSTDVNTPAVQYIIFKATYSDSAELAHILINNSNPNEPWNYNPDDTTTITKNASRMIVGEVQAFKNGVNLASNLAFYNYRSNCVDNSNGTDVMKIGDGDDNTAFVSASYYTDNMYPGYPGGKIFTMGEDCMSDWQTADTCSLNPFDMVIDLGMPMSLDSIRIFTSNKYNQSFKVFACLDLMDRWNNYYQIGEESMAKGSFVYDLVSNSAMASSIAPATYLWSTGETTPEITVSPAQTTTYTCAISGTKTCTDEVQVTVNNCQAVYSSFSTSACGEYILPWGDVLYTSGDYVHTYNNVIGADSIVTAHVEINQPSATIIISDFATDSYTWHGITYTTGGLKYWEGSNVYGCDSIVILDLTMSYTCSPTFSTITIQACDMYNWNGTNYNASGTHTFVTTNAAGCDSTITLNLTITPSTSNTTPATACDSYTWSVNNQTYTSSGSYTSVSGCATSILNLTVNHAVSSSSSATACNSYGWNGNIYSSSGTYTFTTTSRSGCDSMAILTLTIHSGTFTTTTQTACENYEWNGVTYTSSGTYTYNYTNASNCPSRDTLILTITHGFYWTGDIDDDWHTPNNWSCGKVPDETSDVYIPSGIKKYPKLYTNGKCKSVHLLPGSTIQLQDGINLDILGN